MTSRVHQIQANDTLWRFYRYWFESKGCKPEDPKNLCTYVGDAIRGFFFYLHRDASCWKAWLVPTGLLLFTHAFGTGSAFLITYFGLAHNLLVEMSFVTIIIGLLMLALLSFVWAGIVSIRQLNELLWRHTPGAMFGVKNFFARIFTLSARAWIGKICKYLILIGLALSTIYSGFFETDIFLDTALQAGYVIGATVALAAFFTTLMYLKDARMVQAIFSYLVAVKSKACPLVSAPIEQ